MDTFSVNIEGFKQYLVSEKERAEELLRISKSLAETSSSFINKLDFLERAISSADDFSAKTVVESGENSIHEFLKWGFGSVDSLVEIMSKMNQNLEFALDFAEGVENVHYEKILTPCVGAKAQHLDGKIFVFLPHLMPRHQRVTPPTGKPIYPYGHSYADVINHLMHKITSCMCSKSIEAFSQKTFNYFFIYDQPKKFIRDSDSFDTKTITDAISGWLPFGDEATACSFFYQSAVNPAVKSGTYIVVTPGISPLDFDSIFEEIKIFDRAKML